MEMVSSGELDHLHISFMIAGHTKFAPDRLFSVIGSAYKSEDVFTVDELKAICDTCATSHVESGDQVLTWRKSLSEKYSDLLGIRKFHDFMVVKTHDDTVVMKVRENCFGGSWKDSPLHVKNPDAPGIPTVTYSKSHVRQITSEKMDNMTTMYNRFISPDRRPEYLPLCIASFSTSSSATTTTPVSTSNTLSPPTASTTFPHLAVSTSTSTKKRKQSKCSTRYQKSGDISNIFIASDG